MYSIDCEMDHQGYVNISQRLDILSEINSLRSCSYCTVFYSSIRIKLYRLVTLVCTNETKPVLFYSALILH